MTAMKPAKELHVNSLHAIPLTLNDGTETDFGRFRGNGVLAVNAASECGCTGQFAGLDGLYGGHWGRRLEILGVPCKQFGGQEPGDDAEIANFCETNFGVTFPLTAKTNARGKEQHPLYSELTTSKKSILPGTVKWNVEKFLVNRDGDLVGRFAPAVVPASPGLRQAIEAVIA
jgi:glutathione peroxidase